MGKKSLNPVGERLIQRALIARCHPYAYLPRQESKGIGVAGFCGSCVGPPEALAVSELRAAPQKNLSMSTRVCRVEEGLLQDLQGGHAHKYQREYSSERM